MRDNGTRVVKICDFDIAVPLCLFLHACCIAHVGIHPPNVCAGTLPWMALEVERAMQKLEIYGLVNISYLSNGFCKMITINLLKFLHTTFLLWLMAQCLLRLYHGTYPILFLSLLCLQEIDIWSFG